MTPFTLVMAYYENPGMLREHVRIWRRLPDDIRANLHVRIVDDGSPQHPAAETLHGMRAHGLASFELWRMQVDVRWNQDACRNIGVRQAPTQWLLLTDMDHVPHEYTWRRLMGGKLHKESVYRFGRVSMPDCQPYKLHPNSWALTVKKFWEIGGYDEALAGYYGTDGDFLVRAQRYAILEQLKEVLIRYPRDVIPDASTTTLQRKSAEDKKAISDLIKARRENPKWRPRLFSFPCERVL